MAHNQILFERLKEVFGNVIIWNEGSVPAVQYNYSSKQIYPVGGEQYVVRCPFCGGRENLEFSELYGKKDIFGNEVYYLAHCFRECLDVSGRRAELRDMIIGYMPRRRKAVLEMPAEVKVASRLHEEELPEVGLPGYIGYAEDDFGRMEEFEAYFAERGIMRDALSFLRIGRLCTPFNAEFRSLVGAAIIPYYLNGRLVSWQARRVWEPRWEGEPKYKTCRNTRIKSTFFNIDNVKNANPIVIVEGPLDVVPLCHSAIAVCGKSISQQQIRLLRANFTGKLIIVAMDGSAAEETERITKRLISENMMAMSLFLPEDKDPGDYSAEPQILYDRITHLAENILPSSEINILGGGSC